LRLLLARSGGGGGLCVILIIGIVTSLLLSGRLATVIGEVVTSTPNALATTG